MKDIFKAETVTVNQTPTIRDLILCLPEEHQVKILEFLNDAYETMREYGNIEIEAQYETILKEVYNAIKDK